MMRFAANTLPVPGTVTFPSCPTLDCRDQDPFGLPRAPILGAALSASLPMPCASPYPEEVA